MQSIPVFYTPQLVADSESFSPSASKPGKVVSSWCRIGIPIDVREPKPASTEDLYLAHGKSYVDKVLSCNADNGFGNRSAEIAASLPYSTGAMIDAAKEAIRNRNTAVAPVAGFHHAHQHYGRGFCTFNGLIVTAQVLKREGLASRVGILDFDYHFGDGTHDIIRQLNLGDWIAHYSAGAHFHYPSHAKAFLEKIPEIVWQFAGCDIILYQAGADPHKDDPLGGFLDTEELYQRDRSVFECAKAIGVPVVWDLAGGYQEDIRNVLDIHDNTLRACWEAYGDKGL